VAADASGNFVVVWQSYGSSGTDSSGYSIQGQRYSSDGSTRGAEFQVNSYTMGLQRNASVAAKSNGDFVVVWDTPDSSGTDTNGSSIEGQRYASDGSTQGAEFQVNSYTTGDQQFPSVAADADGDFVVVWHSSGSSGTDTSGESIHGQRYASDGPTLGAEFQVNTYTANDQVTASVGANKYGDFVVVWSSYAYPTDPWIRNIQGQRYSVAAAVPALSSTTRFALAAALLLVGAALARAYGNVSRQSRISQ
jgi:hypothetical protein